MILTLKRFRNLALVSLLIGCASVFAAISESPAHLQIHTDFPAFFNAGQIINAGGQLYSFEDQERLYIALVPTTAPGSREIRFYAYAPFFALPFAPLARLPYSVAFAVWGALSLVMFTVGFFLLWSSTPLPIEYRRDAYLIAVSFLPFYAWCVLGGQTSAFGFFCLALAVYFDKTRPILSGAILALLLYKPPLAVFFVPMMIFTKRWSHLIGFGVGGLALGLISLALIGFSGVPMYFAMLREFARLKATGARPTWLEIDLYSQLLWIPNRSIAVTLFVVCFLVALALLVRSWRKGQSWAITITATLILNLYVLLYDATLIIAAVLLSGATLFKVHGTIPIKLRWLLALLFLAPWFHTHLTHMGIQPVTVSLLLLGFYQLLYVQELPDAIRLRSRPADDEAEYIDRVSCRCKRGSRATGELV